MPAINRYLADNTAFHDFDGLMRNRGLNFWFVPHEHYENALHEAGFDSIAFVDRTAAAGAIAVDGMQRVRGELRAQLESRLGESGYLQFVDWTRARMNSLLHGGMAYGHFYTRKLSP